MKSFLTFIFFVSFYTTVIAQSNDKVKIFLNCNESWLCDQDYMRTELKFIDFVRDRFLCDVQVISNVQFTDGGGQSNILTFIGQEKFAGLNDTLKYFNTAVDTEDIKRKKMVQFLKLGLIRYISKSPIATELTISYDASKESNASTTKKYDPYNLWQFSLGTSGFFNGNRNNSSQSFYNSLSASRESEKEKFSFYFNNNISRDKFTYYYKDDLGIDTFEVIEARRDGQYIFASYAQKLDEQWAIGGTSNITRSIFQNLDFKISAQARIEYSFLPYKDFNSQRIVLGYSIGPEYLDYRDTSIYFKAKELQMKHNFSATTSFTKEWGTINLGAEWQNYLSDWHKNNLFIGGGIEWNIFKGFRFGIGGNFQFIHDQISLPKGDASKEDLLTSRRLLATTYEYFVGAGFSYTFGSIYNSQVNPTFRGLNYSLNF